MGRFSYAFQDFDKTKHVRAAIREKGISHKHAREIGISIKGLSIEKSRDYLLSVIKLERSIPFKRYKNQVGHNYREDIRDYHRDIRAESGFILNSARSEALSLVLHNGQITEELSPDRFQDIKYPF
mgnify:CR=1 FL=1